MSLTQVVLSAVLGVLVVGAFILWVRGLLQVFRAVGEPLPAIWWRQALMTTTLVLMLGVIFMPTLELAEVVLLAVFALVVSPVYGMVDQAYWHSVKRRLWGVAARPSQGTTEGAVAGTFAEESTPARRSQSKLLLGAWLGATLMTLSCGALALLGVLTVDDVIGVWIGTGVVLLLWTVWRIVRRNAKGI